MGKSRTHFEQIELRAVKKVVEGELSKTTKSGRRSASVKTARAKEQTQRAGQVAASTAMTSEGE
jgi:hypothetical protein